MGEDVAIDPENARALELDRMRHSCAHLMATAVQELFPEAKFGFGPATEDGFYYDFDLPRPLTPSDLPEIEARMRAHQVAAEPFVREVVSREEAARLFASDPYKLERIEEFAEGEVITTYRNGPFLDLCRGPHVPTTADIGPFKLLSIAGAYWRGDETRPMLQRVYGTAWPTDAELANHLHMLEEARQRDHRRLGKDLGLFYFSEDVGPGLPLFTPKGEVLRYLMEGYVRDTQTRYGYQHVWTGHLVKEDLFRRSGHYDNYQDAMFPPMVDGNTVFRLKPMNCPSHMTLFNEMGTHSYRDLPLRFAEFATLYRYEKTGELQGLTRVRAVTQDDCHIFCRPDQIEEEFSRALNLIREVLDTYDFADYRVRLSLRGGDGKYVADDEKWTRATNALRAALDANGVAYHAAEGEAAFYGPKADFLAKDVLGREWQLSTIQVDFIQPARLNCAYVGEDGQRHTPVVLHRAVTGATERFLGVIIEHFAGNFPAWLAPVQAMIIPITDGQLDFARETGRRLRERGLRVEVNEQPERMQAKIRNAQLQKIPYMLVVGKREVEADSVAVRLRTGEDLGAMPIDAFLDRAVSVIETKSRDL